jgi:hypothetical protein
MPKTPTSKSTICRKKSPLEEPSVKKTQMASGPRVSAEDRNRMIQYAAYHLAEKDGFKPGQEREYWLQAERQIDAVFFSQKAKRTEETH